MLAKIQKMSSDICIKVLEKHMLNCFHIMAVKSLCKIMFPAISLKKSIITFNNSRVSCLSSVAARRWRHM